VAGPGLGKTNRTVDEQDGNCSKKSGAREGVIWNAASGGRRYSYKKITKETSIIERKRKGKSMNEASEAEKAIGVPRLRGRKCM